MAIERHASIAPRPLLTWRRVRAGSVVEATASHRASASLTRSGASVIAASRAGIARCVFAQALSRRLQSRLRRRSPRASAPAQICR
jgi:hypothetical protein